MFFFIIFSNSFRLCVLHIYSHAVLILNNILVTYNIYYKLRYILIYPKPIYLNYLILFKIPEHEYASTQNL